MSIADVFKIFELITMAIAIGVVVRPEILTRRNPQWTKARVRFVSITLLLLFVGGILRQLFPWSPTGSGAETAQVQRVMSDISELIDQNTSDIQNLKSTQVCIASQKESLSGREEMKKLPELIELSAKSTCTCMIDAFRKADVLKDLDRELESGARFDLAMGKLPKLGEIARLSCAN